jgi:hypothetical protein
MYENRAEESMVKGSDQYGILPFYEAFYIDSMLLNTQSAVVSWQRVCECLHMLDGTGTDNTQADCTTEEILDSLQNLIARAAALSRYFWPARDGKNEEHKKRAAQLCHAFSVTDESPLKDRELRNCMEHFDERLDHYLSDLIIGQIIPSYVGNAPRKLEVPQHAFRAYYADIGMFVILGAQYKIQPIVGEISRIHSILLQCTTEGYRLPRGGPHA